MLLTPLAALARPCPAQAVGALLVGMVSEIVYCSVLVGASRPREGAVRMASSRLHATDGAATRAAAVAAPHAERSSPDLGVFPPTFAGVSSQRTMAGLLRRRPLQPL
jgi:hypothetical protein